MSRIEARWVQLGLVAGGLALFEGHALADGFRYVDRDGRAHEVVVRSEDVAEPEMQFDLGMPASPPKRAEVAPNEIPAETLLALAALAALAHEADETAPPPDLRPGRPWGDAPRPARRTLDADAVALDSTPPVAVARASLAYAAMEDAFVGAVRGEPEGDSGLHQASARADGAPPYWSHIREAAELTGVPIELLLAVVKNESAFDRGAISSAGAQGLMQLMPATGRLLGVTDPFNARENLIGGARHLRNLIDKHDGRIRSAIAAYHAGGEAVRRAGGRAPFPVTRLYVDNVLDAYLLYVTRPPTWLVRHAPTDASGAL